MSSDDDQLFEAYAESLRAAWDSYVRQADMLVALSGGTIVLFPVVLGQSGISGLFQSCFGKVGFCLAVVALITAALYRIVSQQFMEHETLGSEKAANIYFTRLDISRLTGAHTPMFRKIAAKHPQLHRVLGFATSITLLTSWVLLGIHLVMPHG